MSEGGIIAEGLRFSYPGDRTKGGFGLKLSRWEVAPGSSVALHGPSGCGKSTLLELVAGILPAQGRLTVLGLNLATASEAERRAHRIAHIGMIFQDFPLVDYLDALENVLLPYRLNTALRLDGAARRRAGLLLSELGLGHQLRSRPDALSQGERQRVAIARALVTEPSLLLADEPTAGLDPARAAAVMDLMGMLRDERGLTLVMVTHDVALLPRFDSVLEVGPLGEGAP